MNGSTGRVPAPVEKRFPSIYMSNGLTIEWPLVPGRNDRVLTAESVAARPWTAMVGQMPMLWTETTLKTGRYHGVQVGRR